MIDDISLCHEVIIISTVYVINSINYAIKENK